MGFKAITQIILTIVSLIIIFMYIQPALLSIRSTQDEIFQYADAVAKEEQLTSTLSELLGVLSSFSSSNLASLYTYLPDDVDTIQIMADVSTIAEASAIRLTDISVGEIELPAQEVVVAGEKIATEQTSFIDFDIQLNGSYEAFKTFLQSVEQNKYPLEVVSLSFGTKVKSDEGVSEIKAQDQVNEDYQLVLRAYAYSSATPLN